MGGIWQRLAVRRGPQKHINLPRWDNTGRQRARAQPRPARVPTAKEKHANDFNDRSLYRALLREKTYLPDERLRSYVHTQLRSRFRSYHNKTKKYGQDADFNVRLLKVRAKGRQQLHKLQRVNAGNHSDLLKILLVTYGRLGKPRRALLDQFLILDGNRDAAPAQSTPLTRADHWVNYTPGLTPRLKALLSSQRQITLESNAVERPPRVKKLVPTIPELNTWHRPMPLRRVKRMTKKWWADLLDKIYPPLQTTEWLRLFDIVTGTRQLEPSKRRGGSIKHNADPLEAIVKAKSGRLRSKKDLQRFVPRRALVRALTDVFRLCPHMHQDVDWKVTWGFKALHDPNIVADIRNSLYERLPTGMSGQGGESCTK